MKKDLSSSLSLIKDQGPAWIHRAKWVMTDPCNIIENGCIQTEGKHIVKVFSWSKHSPLDKSRIIDHGQVLLMPVFVNSHCHLELSALHNTLPLEMGFLPWVEAMLHKKEDFGPAKLIQEAKLQAEGLETHGTGFVADISTMGITRRLFQENIISGVWFQEYLGNQAIDAPVLAQKLACFSLAGHAPHTTAPDLLQNIKTSTRKKGLPFSIHLGETQEELAFLTGQQGSWKNFLDSRGIDTSTWPVGARSCVDYLDKLKLLDELTLAVHLIHANTKDLERLADTGTKVCLCPRSNLALHKNLPDISSMLAKGIAPALGTDSLASCPSLNMLDEMLFIRKHFPDISPSCLIQMATQNSAKALGLDEITGSLAPGKIAWFLKVPVTASHPGQIPERLVSHEW